MKEEWCSRAGKRRFESKSDAQSMMAMIKEKLRVYSCPYCSGYHFSKSDRPKKMTPSERRIVQRNYEERP